MSYQVNKSDAEWREQLSAEEFQVLRKAGTEAPFKGEYTDTKTEGVYACRACGAELFRSTQKFDSHCGWPSFFAPLAEDRVEYIEDRSFGSVRTEVRCANCGSHLGPRLRGRGLRHPDRPALLHQQRLDDAAAAGRDGRGPPRPDLRPQQSTILAIRRSGSPPPWRPHGAACSLRW